MIVRILYIVIYQQFLEQLTAWYMQNNVREFLSFCQIIRFSSSFVPSSSRKFHFRYQIIWSFKSRNHKSSFSSWDIFWINVNVCDISCPWNLWAYFIGQSFSGQNFRKSDLLQKILSAEILSDKLFKNENKNKNKFCSIQSVTCEKPQFCVIMVSKLIFSCEISQLRPRV